jgi:four helix bundle protein
MPGSNNNLSERTTDFALRVVRLYSALPKHTAAQVIGKQVLRSGTSVGAHYREARRARSRAEFVSKINGTIQEIDETSYWLELLVRSGLIPAKRLVDLRTEAEELTAIFTASAKTAKNRQ